MQKSPGACKEHPPGACMCACRISQLHPCLQKVSWCMHVCKNPPVLANCIPLVHVCMHAEPPHCILGRANLAALQHTHANRATLRRGCTNLTKIACSRWTASASRCRWCWRTKSSILGKRGPTSSCIQPPASVCSTTQPRICWSPSPAPTGAACVVWGATLTGILVMISSSPMDPRQRARKNLSPLGKHLQLMVAAPKAAVGSRVPRAMLLPLLHMAAGINVASSTTQRGRSGRATIG